MNNKKYDNGIKLDFDKSKNSKSNVTIDFSQPEYKKYKINTYRYIKAVLKHYDLEYHRGTFRSVMNKLNNNFKNTNKKGFSARVSEAINDVAYVNNYRKLIQDVASGQFAQKQEEKIVENYKSGLKRLGISDELQQILNENPDIILSKTLPDIKDIYVPLTSATRQAFNSKKWYKLNVEGADDIENKIINTLIDKWGYSLKEEQDDNGNIVMKVVKDNE